MKRSAIKLLAMTAALSLALSGCGMNDLLEESSAEETTTTTITERKHVNTTKTAVTELNPDEDDEGLEGYTTTTEEKTYTLENSDVIQTEEYDPDVLATYSTTTTLYTLPPGVTTTAAETTKKTTKKSVSETTKATTTAFTADKLYKPLEGDKFSGQVKYKVVSDTTYLNLRFGPSKKYNVQLKIPDGEIIYGTAQTSNPDDSTEKWVLASYNGTIGWVMLELLQKS